MDVAGSDLGPRVSDTDDGLVQVFFGESDAAQIASRCGAIGAFGQRDALALAFDGHL
jgi:hypothetical protein